MPGSGIGLYIDNVRGELSGIWAKITTLHMAAEDGVWHFGYLPERYMHRVSPTVERTFKEMSSSAVNKLEEALLMCGGKRRTLQVPHDH